MEEGTIALASVLASAAVGIAGISGAVWIARADRRQSRELAVKAGLAAERAAFREALADLAVWLVQVRNVLRYPDAESLAHDLHRSPHLEAVILRYAPSDLRRALAGLDSRLADERWSFEAAYAEALPHRQEKEASIRVADFERAASARQREKAIIEPAMPALMSIERALLSVEDALSATVAPLDWEGPKSPPGPWMRLRTRLPAGGESP